MSCYYGSYPGIRDWQKPRRRTPEIIPPNLDQFGPDLAKEIFRILRARNWQPYAEKCLSCGVPVEPTADRVICQGISNILSKGEGYFILPSLSLAESVDPKKVGVALEVLIKILGGEGPTICIKGGNHPFLYMRLSKNSVAISGKLPAGLIKRAESGMTYPEVSIVYKDFLDNLETLVDSKTGKQVVERVERYERRTWGGGISSW
jgi:hypothetical protein